VKLELEKKIKKTNDSPCPVQHVVSELCGRTLWLWPSTLQYWEKTCLSKMLIVVTNESQIRLIGEWHSITCVGCAHFSNMKLAEEAAEIMRDCLRWSEEQIRRYGIERNYESIRAMQIETGRMRRVAEEADIQSRGNSKAKGD
jgi:hypothetical protein